jgi:hypothetical protein
MLLPCRAAVVAPTLTYAAGVIRRHRAQIGSPWRKLTCGQQALLVLAHLRKGETFAKLTAGFGIGTATAWRYVTETVDVLAARSPKPHRALAKAKERPRQAARPRRTRQRPAQDLAHSAQTPLLPLESRATRQGHARPAVPRVRRMKKAHWSRAIVCCPFARTIGVVSLTITRWPHLRAQARRQDRLLTPSEGTRPVAACLVTCLLTRFVLSMRTAGVVAS